MSDSGREWPSERPISREALMKTIENLTVSNERLIRELDQWKTWGIIEIAVRNSNVMEYMRHWEGRALKAEAKNVKLETPKFDTSGICELCDKEYIRKRRKQRFCSDKCRVAAAMRRFRKNKQEDTNGPEPELTV